MKVWVYVEGKSDCVALSALWRDWKRELGKANWGLHFIHLGGKAKFLKRIGPLVTEKLLGNNHDLVVGLPDLYPSMTESNTRNRHQNLAELKDVQKGLVSQSLNNAGRPSVHHYIERFFPTAFKHDMEMLILAAPDQLKSRLKMRNVPGGWRIPPEDQNQNQPPKTVVKRLFLAECGKAYKETTDSNSILRNAILSEMMFDERGIEQCPEFRSMLDWIGNKTGVFAY